MQLHPIMLKPLVGRDGKPVVNQAVIEHERERRQRFENRVAVPEVMKWSRAADWSRGSSRRGAMTDATAEFFDVLGRRGHVPLLENARGTVRFDLAHGDRTVRWLVTLDEGDVSVSRKNVAADCVVRADRALFDAMARGEANGMAAYLRGELVAEGDAELLLLMQRLFPAPPKRQRSIGRGSDRR
jgi:hypothetical protein